MSETPCEWLDGLLNGDYGFTVYSRKNARAELAQLRADLQAAQERIAAQARQLEEAREIIDQSISDLRGVLSLNDDNTIEEMIQNIVGSLMRWLAANPAAESQP